jgi:hypothetical protein
MMGEGFDSMAVEIINLMKREPCLGQSRQDFPSIKPLLVFLETTNPFLDGGQLLTNIETGNVADGWRGVFESMEPTDPDLEKLIEIGPGNGKKFDTIEDGEVGTKGFVKDPLIKFQPGEFAIEIRGLHEIGWRVTRAMTWEKEIRA